MKILNSRVFPNSKLLSPEKATVDLAGTLVAMNSLTPTKQASGLTHKRNG